jgi:hypothetical protein
MPIQKKKQKNWDQGHILSLLCIIGAQVAYYKTKSGTNRTGSGVEFTYSVGMNRIEYANPSEHSAIVICCSVISKEI